MLKKAEEIQGFIVGRAQRKTRAREEEREKVIESTGWESSLISYEEIKSMESMVFPLFLTCDMKWEFNLVFR